MAAPAPDPAPPPPPPPPPQQLLHHLGAISQAEVDAVLARPLQSAAASWFWLEPDEQGLLWLVQKPEEEQEEDDKQKEEEAAVRSGPAPQQPSSVHDAGLICDLFDAKTAFADTPHRRFSAARARSNPYEALVDGSPFLNRSALKMANLNHLVGGALLTRALSGPEAPFRFADLCGGPGGFSQYVLAVHEARGRPARGWGITLEGADIPWDVEALGRWIVGASSAREEELEQQQQQQQQRQEQRQWVKRKRSRSEEEEEEEEEERGGEKRNRGAVTVAWRLYVGAPVPAVAARRPAAAAPAPRLRVGRHGGPQPARERAEFR